MISLDTNLLVRFFVRDDPAQTKLVEDLVDGLSPERPAFLCREVLVELVWVLGRVYRLDRGRIADLLFELATLEDVRIEAESDTLHALGSYRAGADFADLMILAASGRAEAELFTLDRKLAGQPGARLLEGG